MLSSAWGEEVNVYGVSEDHESRSAASLFHRGTFYQDIITQFEQKLILISAFGRQWLIEIEILNADQQSIHHTISLPCSDNS